MGVVVKSMSGKLTCSYLFETFSEKLMDDSCIQNLTLEIPKISKNLGP